MRLSLFAFATLATLTTLVSARETGLRRQLPQGGNTCEGDDNEPCTPEVGSCTFEKKNGKTQTKDGSDWCLVYKKNGGWSHCIEKDDFWIDDGNGDAEEGSGCFAWTTEEP
jgi:hypothetical protein